MAELDAQYIRELGNAGTLVDGNYAAVDQGADAKKAALSTWKTYYQGSLPASIALKANTADLGAAAFSNSYNDLDDLPSPGGSGTVTSVDFSVPGGVLYTISGNPITTAGTITLTPNTQIANRVFAGPTSGAAAVPSFRSLVVNDLPNSVPYSKLSLTGGIVDADISSGAAIDYDKLDLAGDIVNADIGASAAIAWTKINKTGSSLADLTTRSATALSSGTLDDARLSANVVLIDGSRSFSAVVAGVSPTLSAHLATKGYVDSLVVGLLDDRGNYDASSNVFPSSGGSGTAGAILKGDLWTVSVAGTLGGTAVTAGDIVRAIVDTPGQTAGNWAVSETNIGYTALNASLTDGQIYIGNSSNVGTARTLSGDVTVSDLGVTAIGATKVTSAMLNADVFSTAHTWAGQQTFVAPVLGTPTSVTLTNATGLPVATGISGLGTGVATFLATPSSANLASAVTGETGSGGLVFDTSPTIITPSFTTGFTIGGTAATGTIPRGNGTNFVASAFTMAVPGTSGNVLTSDGTNWTSAAPSGGGGGVTIGTTTITSGTTKRLLFDLAGVVSETAGFEYQSGASPNVSITAQNAAHVGLQVIGAASNSATVMVSKLGSSGTGNFWEGQKSNGNILAWIGTSDGSNANFVLGERANSAASYGFEFSTSASNKLYQAAYESAEYQMQTAIGSGGNKDGVFKIYNTGVTDSGVAFGARNADASYEFVISLGSFTQDLATNQALRVTRTGGTKLTPLSASTVGLIVSSAASPSVDIGQFQVNAGSQMFAINKDGMAVCGGANIASPTAQTIFTQGSRAGTDTNVAGGSLTIQSGTGTGTATPSSLLLKSPIAVASGSGAQTQTTGLEIFNGTAKLTNYTVSGLPTPAATLKGATAFVTDASTTLILGLGGTVTGGGSNNVPVYCDGSAWIYG